MTHLYLLSNVSGKRLNENFPARKNALFKIKYKNWHAQPEFLAKMSKMTSKITSRGRS